jgi:hypothetical protein
MLHVVQFKQGRSTASGVARLALCQAAASLGTGRRGSPRATAPHRIAGTDTNRRLTHGPLCEHGIKGDSATAKRGISLPRERREALEPILHAAPVAVREVRDTLKNGAATGQFEPESLVYPKAWHRFA